MKTIISELEKIRCKEYLDSHLSNWADFTAKIIKSNIINTGNFFCFAPSDISDIELYELDTAKGMNTSVPYAGDVVVDFLGNCLNSQYLKSPKLVAEDNNSEPTDPYIIDLVKTGKKYFLSNNVIFYMCESGDDKKYIENTIHITSAYGCFPFLTDAPVGPFEPYKNINLESQQKILENVCVFFTPIYDDESFLFWIKDGFDKLLDLMEDCIKTYSTNTTNRTNENSNI